MSKLSLVADAQAATQAAQVDGELRAALDALESARLELAARARSLRALVTWLRADGSRRGELAGRFDAYREALDRTCAAQTMLRRVRSARRVAAAGSLASGPALKERSR